MKLAVWANLYDEMNECYFTDWKQGIARQIDKDFTVLYSTVDGANSCLKSAVLEYDAVLFLDVDDIPKPALTHVAKISAKKYDVTAFSMHMFGDVKGYFGTDVDVSRFNVWGFGNSVYRSDALRRLLPIDFDACYPDWETAKRASEAGCSMHVERLPLVNYRIYGQNDRLTKVGDIYVWK